MTREEILNSLNKEQADAAGTVKGPVLVLAGAGTGKTRVITYRIAYMLASGIAPEQILGMTFTNKAAREMKERLAQLVDPKVAKAVTLGTFHSFCIRLLRQECKKLGYLPGFTIADESDQQGLLKQALGKLGLNGCGISTDVAQSTISNWKNKLWTPEDARRQADTAFDHDLAAVYQEYQESLELQNSLDFDDMLLLVHRLFTNFPETLKKYQERYQYLLVDEYQDTNAAQFTVVRMLCGDRCNLCVVGDDDQSIYSWRGADISNILGFPDQFPGAKVVKLEQNYRSTSSILAAANAVIGSNKNRHQKRLWSGLGEGEKVHIVTAKSGEEEADFIAAMIRQTMNKDPKLHYRDFAVLYRSNHLSRQIETNLRRSGIPYRLVGGQEFYKRREIKDAVAYLKLLVNPLDDQSLLRILGTPPRGLSEKAVTALKLGRSTTNTPMLLQLGTQEFQKQMTSKGANGAAGLSAIYQKYKQEFETPGNLVFKIRNFLLDVGYLDGLQRIYKDLQDSMKRRENVDEFINAIAQYETKYSMENPGKQATLLEYLESFALLEENDRTEEDTDNSDAVTLSSVHASKGLEFPIVFVIAIEQNIFPHERALAEGSEDEELRLFYVAITRARKQLYLSRSKTRFHMGMNKPSSPSRFLDHLNDDVAARVNTEDLIETASADDICKAFEEFFKNLK